MARVLPFVGSCCFSSSVVGNVSPERHSCSARFSGMEMHGPVDASAGSLLYKPYLDYLHFALVNSAPGLKSLPLDQDLGFNSVVKSNQRAQVYNWLFESERLRRIRVTYFDAGKSCQAFNALLYPDFRYDLPLLGIDLLSFGSSKVLCVVDFIPLSRDEEYLNKHISKLAPIRQPFASSCSEMSDRFFEKDVFASKEMIFFRSELGASDPALQVPDGELYKVYVQYVDEHLRTLHSMVPQDDEDLKMYIKKQQTGYDQYLADRDPAFRVFSSYFGKPWTHTFCKEFLCPGLDMKTA